MNTFQLVLAGLFVGTLVAAYRDTLFSLIKKGSAKVSGGVQESIAVPLVNDILAVTKLRDKLSAEGCTAGVDACTALLRVIVEYEQPSKGVV